MLLHYILTRMKIFLKPIWSFINCWINYIQQTHPPLFLLSLLWLHVNVDLKLEQNYVLGSLHAIEHKHMDELPEGERLSDNRMLPKVTNEGCWSFIQPETYHRALNCITSPLWAHAMILCFTHKGVHNILCG